MCTLNLCFEVLYKGMDCGYPFEPSRSYEANIYPQSTFLTRGREEKKSPFFSTENYHINT